MVSRHCQAALNQIANAGRPYEVLSKWLKWWLAIKGASATGSLPLLSAEECLSCTLVGDCYQKGSLKNSRAEQELYSFSGRLLTLALSRAYRRKTKRPRICLILALMKRTSSARDLQLQGILAEGNYCCHRTSKQVSTLPPCWPQSLPKHTLYKGKDSPGTGTAEDGQDPLRCFHAQLLQEWSWLPAPHP